MSAAPSATQSPPPEPGARRELRENYGLWIGGEWSAPNGEASYETIDPATERSLTRVARADAADVDRAVRAARRAYEKYWRKLRPAERAKYLYRVARAIGERAHDFARIETRDSGRLLRVTEADVAQTAAGFFYHAGWADKLAWAVESPERTRPFGVTGGIAAANSPLLSAASKIAPALACGNTVVVKPSETAPLSALLLAEACAEADLPPGVVNIVTGDARTGAALAEHPGVDRLAFTGGAEAGRAVRRAHAGRRLPPLLELDGKAALILYDDAALDQAVEAAVVALSGSARSVRSAGWRVLVQESVAPEVLERLQARVAGLVHGDPADDRSDVGPVGSRARLDALLALIESASEDGAGVFAAQTALPEAGYWFRATLVTGIGTASRLLQEAAFGPLAAIQTFRTPDEAVELANAGPAGSATAVWTGSGSLALNTAGRLRAGVVWCNAIERSDASAPEGGFGGTGLGRSGGISGLRAYLET
jgi:aldehyde dehydrogenase (NAD+)